MPEVLASNLFKVCSNKVSTFKFTFHAELFEEKTKSNYSREKLEAKRIQWGRCEEGDFTKSMLGNYQAIGVG